MKQKKTIVADFDKTLTDYDTTIPFAVFCAKRTKKQWLLPLVFLLAISSKLKLISVKKQKEMLLKCFCPQQLKEFENSCFEFSKTIQLNKIGEQMQQNTAVIIASASLKAYLQYCFPEHQIVASEIKTDNTNKIIGLKTHPMGKEKAKVLQQNGIKIIDEFYTDSKTDLPVCRMAKTVHWVRQGEIIKTETK